MLDRLRLPWPRYATARLERPTALAAPRAPADRHVGGAAGKGPWDGLGAVLKQYVSRDITNGKILTTSGYITSPAEVAEHLQARVGSAEWAAAHADKSIQEIVVFYSPHNEITRP